MADKTKIEWADATWNPVVGCSIVSPGCTNCYAMSMAARIERMTTGSHYAGTTQASKAGAVWTGKVALAPEHILNQPLAWKRARRIFVNSMGDLFHEDVPDEWLDRVFAVMALAPRHTFQVLTKRSARMRNYCGTRDRLTIVREKGLVIYGGRMNGKHARDIPTELDWPLPNVWLGVSTEDQRRADERVPDLLATPAAVRFVSAEPLLGQIDFNQIDIAAWLRTLRSDSDVGLHEADPNMKWPLLAPFAHMASGYSSPGLDWIVVGGESGAGARPMHPDWARAIRDQCATAGVPFFFKQWGEWGTGSYLVTTGLPKFRQFASFSEWVNKASTRVNGGLCMDVRGRELRIGADFMRARDEGAFPATIMDRVGKSAAGRLLDGVEHNAFPFQFFSLPTYGADGSARDEAANA